MPDLRALLKKAPGGERKNNVTRSQLSQEAHVFATPKGYLCGMCLRAYSNRNAAVHCLRRCTMTRVGKEPLEVQMHRDTAHFVCRLCHRDFLNPADAALCFSTCLDSASLVLPSAVVAQLKTNLDFYLTHLNTLKNVAPLNHRVAPAIETIARPMPTPPSPVKKPPAQVFVDLSPHRASTEPPTKTRAAPPAPPLVQVSAPQSAEQPPQAFDVNVLYRKPGQKNFTRADARYKCAVCSQSFFTKSEVENCFLSHPEMAGDLQTV